MSRYKYFTDKENTVYVVTRYAGKEVKSVAKCSPVDTYDIEKGCMLAKARVDEKVANKRLKNATMKYEAAKEAYKMATERLISMKDYLKSAKQEVKDTHKHVKKLEKSF